MTACSVQKHVGLGGNLTKIALYRIKITIVPFSSRLFKILDPSQFIRTRKGMAPKKSLQHSSIPIGKSEIKTLGDSRFSNRKILMAMDFKFSGNCEISIQGKATCQSDPNCVLISASKNTKIKVSGTGFYLLEILVSFCLLELILVRSIGMMVKWRKKTEKGGECWNFY